MIRGKTWSSCPQAAHSLIGDTEANEHLQCSVIGAGRVGSTGHFSGNMEDQEEEEALTGGEGDKVRKPSERGGI